METQSSALFDEIQNHESRIRLGEKKLSENIEATIKSQEFYKLPLKNILSVVSQANFKSLKDSVSLIHTMVKNIISSHSNEKETLFLLESLNETNIPYMELNDIIELLNLFPNIYLFKRISAMLSSSHNDLCELDAKIIQCFKKYPPSLVSPVQNNDLENVKLIVENSNADINAEFGTGKICFSGEGKQSILFHACEKNFTEIALYLLDKGADPNHISFIDGSFLLPEDCACKNGNLEIIKSLVKHGAKMCDPFQEQPSVVHAVKSGHLDVVKYFIEECPNNPDIDINSLLSSAISSRQVSIVKYLLSKGAQANPTNGQYSPLHCACSGLSRYSSYSHSEDKNKGKEEESIFDIIKLLVQAGANIHARDKYGVVPFHILCQNGPLRIVQYFVEHGADIHIRDNKYRDTPLHYVAMGGIRYETAEYLISIGADKQCKNNRGQRPYDLLRSPIMSSRPESLKLKEILK